MLLAVMLTLLPIAYSSTKYIWLYRNRIVSHTFKRGQHKWVSLDTKFAKQLAEGTITVWFDVAQTMTQDIMVIGAGRTMIVITLQRIRYYNTDYAPDKKYQSDFGEVRGQTIIWDCYYK